MGEKLLSRKEMGKISGEIYICLQRLSAYYVRGKGKLFSRGEYKGKIFLPLEHHQGHGVCSGSVVIRLSGVQMSG